MRKVWIAVSVSCVVAAFAFSAWAADPSSDSAKVASLINELKTAGPDGLAAMKPIPIRRFEVPGPGVDVMRARLRETYAVDGLGQDEVELTGWVAVRHGMARAAAGFNEVNWNTAVLDTAFVGMDLRGTSKLFGPVQVKLDESRPAVGQVGHIELPAGARAELMRLAANQPAKARTSKATTVNPPVKPNVNGACAAKVNVAVLMPNLGLEMVTDHPVSWYSLVETIPPVGTTASIANEPVRLRNNGREVATLQGGIVDFREVVRHVSVTPQYDRVASARTVKK
jgi:hypothetical protein